MATDNLLSWPRVVEGERVETVATPLLRVDLPADILAGRQQLTQVYRLLELFIAGLLFTAGGIQLFTAGGKSHSRGEYTYSSRRVFSVGS